MLSKRTKLKAIALLHYLAPMVATVRLSNLWAQVLQEKAFRLQTESRSDRISSSAALSAHAFPPESKYLLETRKLLRYR